MDRHDAVYDGKPLSPATIRILRLQPASSLEFSALDDAVTCTTEVLCLDDNPEFTALSYCWGNGGFSHTMTCNGVQMNITESLDRALRWFRQSVADNFRNHSQIAKVTSLVIWADAVCINQNDVEEKNAQVQLMGRIYSQAARVFIYLGESTPLSKTGLEFAGKLWKSAVDWGKKHLEMDSIAALQSMPLPQRHDPGWRGLIDILTRPWFSRCWIVQEFSMCSNRVFVCGDTSFTWMLLDTVVRLVYENIEVSTLLAEKMESRVEKRSPRFWDSTRLTSLFILKALAGTVATDEWFEAMRNTRVPKSRFPLWDLLLLAGPVFDATNVRDKVYALMGMAADMNALPKPDYGLSVGKTFEMFARYFISLGMGMDVISIAGMERAELDMPSWVPDWSTYPWQLTWNHHDNNKDNTSDAGKGTKPNVRFKSPDSSQLVATGAILDKITHLSQPMREADIGQSHSHKAWVHSSKDVLRDSSLKLSPAEVDHILGEVITAGDPDAVVDDTISALKALEGCMEKFLHMNVMMDPPIYENALHKYQIYILSSVSMMAGTKLFATEHGRVGLAPNPTMVGDEICVFAGGKVPYIVRPKGEAYLLVGKVYVRGIMKGEAVEPPGFELGDIALI